MSNSTPSSNGSANGRSSQWTEVTKESSCPICGKDHRCKMSVDGNAVCCFRSQQAPAGWRIKKPHGEGATFLREGAGKSPRKPRASKQSATAQKRRQLTADRLHEAYSLLIGKLNLLPPHIVEMMERGMSQEEAERRQYRGMPVTRDPRARIAAELANDLGDDFEAVPGFGFKDGKPTLYGAVGMLIPIRDVQSRIVAIVIRADHSLDENKYTLLSSRKYGGNSPGSPPHVPLGVTGPINCVRVIEGHLKADVVSVFDSLPTISCGGVGNWRSAIDLAKDLEAKIVRVAFDADARNNYRVAYQLLVFVRSLREVGLAVELERWSLADGKGLDDLLAAGKKPEVLVGDDAVAAAEEIARAAGVDPDTVKSAPAAPTANDIGEDDEEKKSQATILVEYAGQAELFHDADGEAYARFQAVNGEHWEVWRVKSRGFRRWLRHQYYLEERKAPSAQAVQDAINVIEAQAVYDGDQRSVFIRVAEHEGRIYIDLANDRWQAVEIDRDGWCVVDNPLVMFRRAKAMRALPLPNRDGDVAELRRFINISDDDWPLVLGWIVAAMQPIGPYPVLAVYGEHGSAKTSLCKYVRSLIDPNEAALRSESRDTRDLMISANNGWIVALDNISALNAWFSDCLCRLATGGGFSTRTLYENDDETIFNAKRPAILNCIDDVVTRSDLLDRCVILNLPRIEDSNRKTEKKLNPEFEAALPTILGGLLTAVSTAMRNEDTVVLPNPPRMADFAIWATAAEPALGLNPGDFIRAYTMNRAAGNETAIEAMPIGRPVIEFVRSVTDWSGTMTDLLAELNQRVADDVRKLAGWPKNGRSLSSKLRRLAPNLRRAGLGVEFDDRRGHKGDRMIKLWSQPERNEDIPSASSAPSEPDVQHETDCSTADANADVMPDDQRATETPSSADVPKSFEQNGQAGAADDADAKRAADSDDDDWFFV